jgi:hypothetical protein
LEALWKGIGGMQGFSQSPSKPSAAAGPTADCCYMPNFTNYEINISISYNFFPQEDYYNKYKFYKLPKQIQLS